MEPSLPDEETSCLGTKDWPHAPPHRLQGAGVYFVTARTLGRVPYFSTPERLTFARDTLLQLAEKYEWRLEAWAFLTNHYHFVAHCPQNKDGAKSLTSFLRHLHSNLTRYVNRADAVEGRKVWHNYRETHLTYQHSYLARLHYTHANAVHHGIVRAAEDYEWCSASVFRKACTPAWFKTVTSFQFSEIATADDDN